MPSPRTGTKVPIRARRPRGRSRSLLAVDGVRGLELGFRHLPVGSIAFDAPEEAGLVALMTGCTGLLHLNKQGVAIAVEGDVLDHLDMPAGLALHPELLARTAPEKGATRLDRLLERSPVHPRHHQDVTRINTLCNRRHESVCVVNHARQLIGSGKNDAPP